jgi:diaminopimelate epimerase
MTPSLAFTKMHGLGNDFVMLEHAPDTTNMPQLVAQLCNRHTGIGADGVIWPEKPSDPSRFDIQFVYTNSDGSRAEMCGNGIRCFARYLVPRAAAWGLDLSKPITAETLAGPIVLQLNPDDSVTVDMGHPILDPSRIPTTLTGSTLLLNQPVAVLDQTVYLTPVSMGNPHAIIFTDHVLDNQTTNSNLDPALYGPAMEIHPAFPAKTNVEFVTVTSPDHVQVVVWERGCGFTLACGTGACAVAVAGVLLGKTNHTVTVSLPGGDLLIEWPDPTATVTMTGPATTVYTGHFLL